MLTIVNQISAASGKPYESQATSVGMSGPIACDAYGQCAKFKPAVYEFVADDPKTFSVGKNPKKVWP